MSVHPAKTQFSLGIRPVWSESSLCAQWVAKGPRFLHADSEDSDQPGRMPRLNWVFAGRTLTLLVLSCRGSYCFAFSYCFVYPTDTSSDKPSHAMYLVWKLFSKFTMKTSFSAYGIRLFEPAHDKTNKVTCSSSKDLDQPWHPSSLIRVFAVCMKKAWVLSYPFSLQRRLIRLCHCAGWSYSLLNAHAIMLVLSCCGSILELSIHEILQLHVYSLLLLQMAYLSF